MFGLGVSEILIILVAALIFIGPKKLPALAKTLGSAFREFQNATKGLTQNIHEPMKHTVDESKPETSSLQEEDSSSNESSSKDA